MTGAIDSNALEHDPRSGVFAVLARLRFLRGTPLDPFGYAHERRVDGDVAAEEAEQRRRGVDVAQLGDVAEQALAVREERGAEDGERRVLGAADTNRTAERSAAADTDGIHAAESTTRSPQTPST